MLNLPNIKYIKYCNAQPSPPPIPGEVKKKSPEELSFSLENMKARGGTYKKAAPGALV